MITISAGNCSFSLTTITSPRPKEPQLTASPPDSLCVRLLFSCLSDFYLTKSSKKSLIIETEMTKHNGGKLVGFPNVIEIGLIHCKTHTTRKKMLAGFVIWWNKFKGKKLHQVYLLVLTLFEGWGLGVILNSHYASSSSITVRKIETRSALVTRFDLKEGFCCYSG